VPPYLPFLLALCKLGSPKGKYSRQHSFRPIGSTVKLKSLVEHWTRQSRYQTKLKMASEGQADKYEVLEKIGQGSFGVIRKVKRKQDGMVSPNTLVECAHISFGRPRIFARMS